MNAGIRTLSDKQVLEKNGPCMHLSVKFLGDVCLQSEGVSEEKENRWPQKRERSDKGESQKLRDSLENKPSDSS